MIFQPYIFNKKKNFKLKKKIWGGGDVLRDEKMNSLLFACIYLGH